MRSVCAILFVVILGTGLALRVHFINDTLPYPRHIDEPLYTNGALGIMKTGDFNPHFFMKPSLPLYLTLGGLTFGYLNASQSAKVRGVEQIGSVAYPYYSHRSIIRPARVLFAAISVIGLGLAGIVAFQLSGASATLFLAPLILSLSSWFLNLSWSYVNPDIVGCTLALGALAYVLARWPLDGVVEKAIVPGFLCGLAVATKYNFASLVLAPLLAIWLAPSSGRPSRSLWLVAFLVAGFLLAAPYTLFDFHAFLEDFGEELRAYTTWEANRSGPYSSRLLRPWHDCLRDYGAASALFAAFGLAACVRQSWRRAVVVAAFPVSLALVMASYPLYFPRNVLTSFAVCAVFAAIGVVEISRIAAARLPAIVPTWSRAIRTASPIAVLLVLLATAPWRRIYEAYSIPADSRNQAVRWILKNLPKQSTLLVPTDLSMAVGSLRPTFTIVESEFARIPDAIPNGGSSVYALVPVFDEYRHARGQSRALNAVAGRLTGTDLAQFGRFALIMGYTATVPWGDPRFVIRQVDKGQS